MPEFDFLKSFLSAHSSTYLYLKKKEKKKRDVLTLIQPLKEFPEGVWRPPGTSARIVLVFSWVPRNAPVAGCLSPKKVKL